MDRKQLVIVYSYDEGEIHILSKMPYQNYFLICTKLAYNLYFRVI